MSTAAVILAAGSGSRFGKSVAKLLADSRGRPLLAHALAAAEGASLDELVVVSGAVDLAAVVPESATLLRNSDWELGQASSIRVAVDWCQRNGHEAIVVGLGDQPAVTPEDWKAIASSDAKPVAVATYATSGRGARVGGRTGAWGYPVRLAAEVWPGLPIDGDAGIEAFVDRHPELVTEVACAGRQVDIDTREDLRRWQ